MLNNLETTNIISSPSRTAIFLPIAFPPTVNEEVIELTTIIASTEDIPNLTDNNIPINAEREPHTIPHMSPITSLHIEDILLPFLIKYTPSFAH